MTMRTTYEIDCEGCGKTETVRREKKPNERLPEFVVPAGWTQTKQGEFCPECTAAANGG